MEKRFLEMAVVAVFVLCLLAEPGFGRIWFSTQGGGKQIWITADSITSRSTDGGSANYMVDWTAINTLSGSAFSFRDPAGVQSSTQKDWWAEYQIPAASAPFALTGTWTFWARATQRRWELLNAQPGSPGWSTGETVFNESDFLVANGDPTDLNVSAPTDLDWLGAFSNSNAAADVVFQSIYAGGQHDFDSWGWRSREATGGGPADNLLRQKEFNVINGKIAFRLYERESGAGNSLVDTIVWASDASYLPTDADAKAAGVPEPASLALLGFASLTLLRRRRA